MSKCSICKRPTLRAICYGCSKPRPPSDIERLAVEYIADLSGKTYAALYDAVLAAHPELAKP